MAQLKDLLVEGKSRFIDKIYASDQFISKVVQGTSPFLIDSSTLVSNLNADLLDGFHAFGTDNISNNRYLLKQAKIDIGATTEEAYYRIATLSNGVSSNNRDALFYTIDIIFNRYWLYRVRHRGVSATDREYTIAVIATNSSASDLRIYYGAYNESTEIFVKQVASSTTLKTILTKVFVEGQRGSTLINYIQLDTTPVTTSSYTNYYSGAMSISIPWDNITGKPSAATSFGYIGTTAVQASQSDGQNVTGIGTILWPGATREILRFSNNNSTWYSGLKYSWSGNTTVALWGKHANTQFVWHAGTDFTANDVNGTSNRGYDFQVGRIDNNLEVRSSGIMNAAAFVEHNTTPTNVFLLKPKSATYITTTSSVTGAITITLPASIDNTMTSMWIDVYLYSTNKSFSVHVGGYTYNNSTWANNPFAMVYGAEWTVRLGHNGTNFIIYIGETNTSWTYPQIAVRDVLCGFQPSSANWEKDFAISFSTSFSNVTATITNYALTTKNILLDNVLTLKAGAYTADTTWTYPGGSYASVKYPNMRLIGDSTYGLSTIEFISQKGDTAINKPTDCAFIQFQPYGVTTQTAIGTQPTLASSGEANRLVIGVNNDSTDSLILQTPTTTGLKHAVGTGLYTIWDSGNDGSDSGLDADLLDGVHLNGLFTALTSNTTNPVSATIGGVTKSISQATLRTSLGLGTMAYESSSNYFNKSERLFGNNLLRKNGLQNTTSTSVSYDYATNTYTIVSKTGLASYNGSGVSIKSSGSWKVKVPFGYHYRVSFDILLPSEHSICYDQNNTVETGTAWNGNDNDTDRVGLNHNPVEANVWTNISWGGANLDTRNTNKVDLIIYDCFGLNTTNDSNTITWYIRNARVELGRGVGNWSTADNDIVHVYGNEDIEGTKTFKNAQGTAPFAVDSSTLVTNLNVDLLDGKHASEFATSGHSHSFITSAGFASNGTTSLSSWGTLTTANGYTGVLNINDPNGGSWEVAYKGGQQFHQIDGYYYQNEGRYRVTDVTETVTALGTSENYLTWTKNGSTNNITVPYATASNTTNVLNVTGINTETDITESGIRGYFGGGSTWAGSISSMAYAAILTFGNPSRGWQLWAQRATADGMYWRRGNSAATAWEEPRLFLDSSNYTSYTVTKTGGGASGTWGINITGTAAGLSAVIANDKLPTRLRELCTAQTIADACLGTNSGWAYVTSGSPFSYIINKSDYMLLSTGYNVSWCGQIAENFYSNDIAFRTKNSGTWTEWAYPILYRPSNQLSNCNDVSTTGIWTNSGFSNKPSGVSNWGSLFNIRLYKDNNTYHRQLFFDCYGTDKIWTRSDNGGSWTSWVEIVRNTGTWGINISGNAATATKLGTDTVGASNRPIYLNAGVPTVTNPGEAYLSWGGQNISGNYGPVDAGILPELGANRTAFISPDNIVVQYSTNGGSSWTDYGATAAEKVNLFNGNGAAFKVGKNSTTGVDYTNYRLRIILTPGGLYTTLNKFIILVSTSGSSGCWCTIDARLKSNVNSSTDTWTTFANQVGISGWSGYNVINTSGLTTYGGTPASQYGEIRFTFGNTGYSTSYPGLTVTKIFCIGGVGWTTPSNLARTGHMYTYDASQNVSFPANVTASSFIGNASSATTATDATYLSLITSSTANYADSAKGKKYTFSVYSLTGSAPTPVSGTGPSTGDGFFMVYNWNDSYVTQIAVDLDPTHKLAIRHWKNDASTWREWKNILTSATSYVSNGYGVIDGTTITKVSYADSVGSHTHPINQITWAGGLNLTPTATANGQEWSIDLSPGSYTGTYWHVWSTPNSKSIFRCWPDNNYADVPNGNFAVGTSANSSYRLDVSGNTRIVYNTTYNNTPILTLSNSSFAGTNCCWATSSLASAMVANSKYIHIIGKASSTCNQAYFGYHHIADGCTNNFATIGLYAKDELVNILANGSVGIGTTAPTQKLHVVGSGKFEGGIGSKGTNGNTSGGGAYIVHPAGGVYATSTSSVTGYLKITLPQKGKNTMMSFDVTIYTYDGTNQSYTTYHISGYEYSTNGWHEPVTKVYSDGIGPYTNLTVRLGNDGTYACVTIGEANTVWSYPQVTVHNIMTGYSNCGVDTWIGGWAVGFTTTALTTVVATRSSVNTQNINVSGVSGSAPYLTLTYCTSGTNDGVWNTIKNGKTNPTTNKVNFYTIYNNGGPTTYGEMLEILSYNSNHWQPQLWFGAGKSGHMYYRNKNYNDDTWGNWLTIIDSGNIGSQSVNYATSAGSTTNSTYASVLRDPTYYTSSSRRNSANITFADGGLHYYLATSSMSAANGKPDSDGHILHMAWDNSKWDAQLTLPTSATGVMQWRVQTNGTDASWSPWKTVIDSSNIGSQSVAYATVASKISDITASDAASSTATWRRVWFSYNDNVTGRPAYSDNFAYQTSTGTLKVGKLSITGAAGNSWLGGQQDGPITLNDATNTGSYWSWIRQTNTSSSKYFSIGVLNTSLYIIGSASSRTDNGYDYGWRFDVNNGWAYGNFQNADTVDGLHASDFARKIAAGTTVAMANAGGTITVETNKIIPVTTTGTSAVTFNFTWNSPAACDEAHVIITGSGSSKTITIGTVNSDSTNTKKNNTAIKVTSGGYGEISIVYFDSKYFIRAVGN